MGKVVAAHVDDAKVCPFPELASVSPAGSIQTRGFLCTPDRPLWLWMHKSEFGTPFPQGLAHFHPEHEIIFVVEGGMIVGRHIHKPGTALAVDADTVYGFGVDAGGLGFTNFRPCEPHFVMMSRNGPEHAPISESDHLATSTLISRSANSA